MKTIKAFTLLEMMIALVLSSIVFSISFVCYSMILKQFLNYKHSSTLIQEAGQLQTTLQTDFFNSQLIQYNDITATFIFFERPSVKYLFVKDFVLRESNNRTDTFHVLVGKPEVRYELNLLRENSLVNDLRLNLKVAEADEVFHFVKRYSSYDLMNETNNSQ